MSWAQMIRTVFVTLAMMGILWPTGDVRATQPVRLTMSPEGRLPDVQLDSAGCLQGVVVDGQGHGQPGVVVELVRLTDGFTCRAKTDTEGRFALNAAKGGISRLETSEGGSLCRVWTADAAPPQAAQSIFVVNDRQVHRGQRPIRELFISDPILVATLVAAAIAIPIAVHKSRDDSPSGS